MMKGIAAVLKQLEREREQLDSQITQLDRALNTLSGLDGRRGAYRRGPRRLSAAARARIAAAQRARWAKWKAQQRKKAA